MYCKMSDLHEVLFLWITNFVIITILGIGSLWKL